ncbi:MAG: hypothetical protein R2705_03115 [Ilumatobacteraceae bacterium]
MLETLAVSRHARWLRRFAIMLTLSVVIAVMGPLDGLGCRGHRGDARRPTLAPVLGTAACCRWDG